MNNGKAINLERLLSLVSKHGSEKLSLQCDVCREIIELKEQFLNNQAIVEHVQNCHNCGSIGWSNCKYYRQNLDQNTKHSECSTEEKK